MSSSEKERMGPYIVKLSNKKSAVNLLNISVKTTTFTMFLLTARWEKRRKTVSYQTKTCDHNIFQTNFKDHFYHTCGALPYKQKESVSKDECLSFFVLQGSTLRKRKMYEEFLSKVSILGKSVHM